MSSITRELRPSTISQQQPRVQSSSSSRTILPIVTTASLLISPAKRTIVRPEVTALKVSERISTFFVDRKMQEVLGCDMSRGKTILQGSRAPKGFQAAHYCLQPALVDNAKEVMKTRVIQNGVTPKKSERFLRSRIENVMTPELRMLHEKRNDASFVDTFFARVETTSISGTYYEKRRNTTFENPDESNQVDTMLEAYLKQKKLFEKPAKEATKELVDEMLTFYNASIENLESRIEKIERFHELEKAIILFETTGGDQKAYGENVSELLVLKKELTEKKLGSPRWHAVKERRRDFSTLVLIAKDPSKYTSLQFRLKTPSLQPIDKTVEHYRLLLEEVKLQKNEAQRFQAKDALDQLELLHFGVKESADRRAPKTPEVESQVFSLLKRSPKQMIRKPLVPKQLML